MQRSRFLCWQGSGDRDLGSHVGLRVESGGFEGIGASPGIVSVILNITLLIALLIPELCKTPTFPKWSKYQYSRYLVQMFGPRKYTLCYHDITWEPLRIMKYGQARPSRTLDSILKHRGSRN